MLRLFITAGLLLSIFFGFIYISQQRSQTADITPAKTNTFDSPFASSPTPTTAPQVSLVTPPQSKILSTNYHVFQSFNNCGPAALSMALSYYGINVSQQQLGQDLRPYQNPQGDNDDKSVTLEELAEKAKDYDLIPYHKPNGSIDQIKLFIAHDLPVITRTYLKEDEDIGHYRIVKGYNTTTSELIQDDSLQGKNLRYSYQSFNNLWKDFSFEYLVLVPKDKQQIVEAILGEDVDHKTAWNKAVIRANQRLASNPNDTVARFNLSIALYEIGDYKGSTEEFAKVENKLSMRTLWYQIEPIKAYYELGDYKKVFSITDKILTTHNRAFSELYLLRGQIYQKQGDITAARSEFEKAVLYNKNLLAAQKALNSSSQH